MSQAMIMKTKMLVARSGRWRKRTSTIMLLLILVGGLATLTGSCTPLRSGKSETAATPDYNPVINPSDFVDRIDNRYFPLQPGTTFISTGQEEGNAQRDEMVVTFETKVILGVRCVVVHDTVMNDGTLAEDTLDWYAQDKAGNVWYFGEATAEYENGKVVSREGSWEAGVNGAQPGIIMEADPQLYSSYRQEYSAGVAEDMAEVLSLTAPASVPYGSYQQTLLTKEWTPLEPDVVEQKYYAPGVGEVRSVTVKGGSEELKLVEVRHSAGVTSGAHGVRAALTSKDGDAP
jgi:hypothetical protein